MSRTVALIPSRMESSRLPGKPLLDIHGIPMIVHVYLRTRLAKSIDEAFVVTDSPLIRDVVESYGGKTIMTGSHHQTGSDRIAEAARTIDCDYIVNVQGDEALVNPLHVDSAVSLLHDDPNLQVGILVNKYFKKNSISDIKTVLDLNNNVLYFSRADIPFGASQFYKAYHVVPFTCSFLQTYTSLSRTTNEISESNEYLRILDHGYRIKAKEVSSPAISVDTSQDLVEVTKLMNEDSIFPKYSHIASTSSE